jgi:hypothetical protein
VSEEGRLVIVPIVMCVTQSATSSSLMASLSEDGMMLKPLCFCMKYTLLRIPEPEEVVSAGRSACLVALLLLLPLLLLLLLLLLSVCAFFCDALPLAPNEKIPDRRFIPGPDQSAPLLLMASPTDRGVNPEHS